jgi:hypothetical protein
MSQSKEPYAPPADDGGDQGAFTVPSDSLAQPNATQAETPDRSSAGSLWRGTGHARAEKYGLWKGSLFTLLVTVLVGGLTVAVSYCNVH